jgi:hypothetical protein
MKNIKEIKNDLSLEPYFLDYLRYSEECGELPEDFPENISPEEQERIMIKAEKVDNALAHLIDVINEKYETDFDIEEIEEEDEIANILNDTCEDYVSKYGFEYIMSRPFEFILDDNPEITDLILENGINFCEKCNTKLKELKFDELPEEIKAEYNDMKNSIQYYLYCPECDEYSIISLN